MVYNYRLSYPAGYKVVKLSSTFTSYNIKVKNTRAVTNNYFHNLSISCLSIKCQKMVQNVDRCFPKLTTQRYSVYCHRGLKKTRKYSHLRSRNQRILTLFLKKKTQNDESNT